MAGIFGSVSRKGNCAESLYYGIDYHCHLGTDYAGMAVFGDNGMERKIHDIRGENFRPKFQLDYQKMKGRYGVGHAIGYANQSGIPYVRPIVKYTPSWPRSYMPSDQSTRDLIANMKLIAIPDLIHGKKIVICDDSIVRGTQLRKMIKDKMVANGAKEVHLRIACPPLMFPCIYNQSTRTTGELAARKAIRVLEGKDAPDVAEYLDHKSPKYRQMVDTVASELGAASLMYQRLEDMASAIGRPVDEICTFCWTGRTNDE
jgi:amidophosphoribosyltransferase